MDEFRFNENAPGKVKISKEGFHYFVPDPLPPTLEISSGLMDKFISTSMRISRLDGKLSAMDEKERYALIDAFAIKEAVTSSNLEGIETDAESIYREEKEKEKDGRKALNNQEVRNYKNALKVGMDAISDRPIDLDLILKMHGILMEGVRGKEKEPGKIRTRPNKVGRPGDSFEDAVFVPPLPEYVPDLMSNLLEFINMDSGNVLRDSAIAHYQFETIHPFLDGNGRIGRLLIMLILKRRGAMEFPFLYLSEYFNRRRKVYSNILFEVSCKGNYERWLNYFLDGVSSQTERADQAVMELTAFRRNLYRLSENDNKLRKVCEMLFENPFIRVRDVKNRLGITDPTAQKLINVLADNGILTEDPEKRKGRLYKAQYILDILDRIDDEGGAWY